MWRVDLDAPASEDEASYAIMVSRHASITAPEGYVNVCGVFLPVRAPGRRRREPRAIAHGRVQHTFVRTDSTLSCLHATALAVQQSRAVLLRGTAACGKTCLISELATLTNNEDLLTIYMDDQIDAKSLLGAYVCSATPGEYHWQPGPITQAVRQGRWVVLDNLHLAPLEVTTILERLLSSRQLHITQRDEILQAHPNFRLFGTVQLDAHSARSTAHAPAEDAASPHWVIVTMADAQRADQLRVLAARFPALSQLLLLFMSLMDVVHSAAASTYDAASSAERSDMVCDTMDACLAAWHTITQQCMREAGLRAGAEALALGKPLGMHDLVKCCLRVATLHADTLERARLEQGYAAIAVQPEEVLRMPHELRAAVLTEASEVFCGFAVGEASKLALVKTFARLLGLPETLGVQLLSLSKPSLSARAGQLSVGRVRLAQDADAVRGRALVSSLSTTAHFAQTGHAMRLMESIAAAVKQTEPLLLVGESGTGKTTLVQHIARTLGKQLVVVNLSNQSDASDLLGGYKPLQVGLSLVPLANRFDYLMRATWPTGNNEEFLARVAKFVKARNWAKLVKAFELALGKVRAAAEALAAKQAAKKCRLDVDLTAQWRAFEREARLAARAIEVSEGGFAFHFVEGVLVDAVREGKWLLMDEINLAPPQVLERVMGLLESAEGSLVLLERGDSEVVTRHPDFRLFAAMNPATDSGKRHLPPQIRTHFTELYVSEPSSDTDLAAIVKACLSGIAGANAPIDGIVTFYTAVRAAVLDLSDGVGSPAYNLRSLSRALQYAVKAAPVFGLPRALLDGMFMAFVAMLDEPSAARVTALIKRHIFGGGTLPVVHVQSHEPPTALTASGHRHVNVEGVWVEVGSVPLPGEGGPSVDHYVVTPAVRKHVRAIARAVFLRRFPVLLQGPTSSGKTSLVEYVARCTGHTFVRINNHEHTDLQEYLGTYVSDASGRLVFQEGALVRAVRQGHWVVLDELNLAPTEVLEALNRLLDDNRELFVPEIQEVIKPHPHFMLFGTQNPPGAYAGRKVLSRAFRSRFLEMNIDELPAEELVTILERRCAIAPSHASKLVAVMQELQRRRAAADVFAGKHGFITPRDLFRWAGRGAISYEELALNGYLILAERLRSPEERAVVAEVLSTVLKVTFNIDATYAAEGSKPLQHLRTVLGASNGALSSHDLSVADTLSGIVWTKALQRMYCLVSRCMEHGEPVLMTGETGVGKTTLCQMLAFMKQQRLHIINCNMHTESGDILGGYRPSRNRQAAISGFVTAFDAAARSDVFLAAGMNPPKLPGTFEAVAISRALADLHERAAAARVKCAEHASLPALLEAVDAAAASAAVAAAPFVWEDGPLVRAMRDGDIVLIDEINLAEDAVLERLNSVLEPGRTLTLTEKGSASGAEIIVASPTFRVIATMNPGGDHGKRDLSPALSNRFTQVWVPAIEDLSEISVIVRAHLGDASVADAVTPMLLDFWQWFQKLPAPGKGPLSLRDILAWCAFIRAQAPTLGAVCAYVHGAFLVIIDGLGLGQGVSAAVSAELSASCVAHIQGQVPTCQHADIVATAACRGAPLAPPAVMRMGPEQIKWWGIEPFYVPAGEQLAAAGPDVYHLGAPTTARNTFRLLRAMQLQKAVLLEGSPGVGKSSLVAAIAAAAGHHLVRINLSDQTDMMDLLGADLPSADGTAGSFEWSDGPLLAAIKAGHWVLLDELNLASQSVLEGLNAVLDHRREVFIPELNATFHCPSTFRVFAAQNPIQEGGGRKGLPKSFLNRFSRVLIDLLQREDLTLIAASLHPTLPQNVLTLMVAFVDALHRAVNVERRFGQHGAPWEFNLRDLLRWCDLVAADGEAHDAAAMQCSGPQHEASERLCGAVAHYARMLFVDRMRDASDRGAVASLFAEIWATRDVGSLPHVDISSDLKADVRLLSSKVSVGRMTLDRRGADPAAMPPRGDDLLLSTQHVSAAKLALASSRELEWVVTACSRGWPALCVSPDPELAADAIRSLAALCARPLVTVPLTAASDTSELLGGFEQLDPLRTAATAATAIASICKALVRELLAAESGGGPGFQAAHAAALRVAAALPALVQIRAQNGDSDELTSAQQAVASLRSSLAVIEAATGTVPERCAALGPRLLQAQRLVDEAESLAASASVGGRFAWVDGYLLSAIEQGHWVLMMHPNACSAAVLDRLNSLLERAGSLYVNECGTTAAGPRIAKPHPDFRLFLVIDPARGELSRAMRNRGIEVYLSADGAHLSTDGAIVHAKALRVQNNIAAAHVPGWVLPAWLSATYSAVYGASSARSNRDSLQYVRRTSSHLDAAMALVRSGYPPLMALAVASSLTQLEPSVETHAGAVVAPGDPERTAFSLASLRTFPGALHQNSGASAVLTSTNAVAPSVRISAANTSGCPDAFMPLTADAVTAGASTQSAAALRLARTCLSQFLVANCMSCGQAATEARLLAVRDPVHAGLTNLSSTALQPYELQQALVASLVNAMPGPKCDGAVERFSSDLGALALSIGGAHRGFGRDIAHGMPGLSLLAAQSCARLVSSEHGWTSSPPTSCAATMALLYSAELAALQLQDLLATVSDAQLNDANVAPTVLECSATAHVAGRPRPQPPAHAHAVVPSLFAFFAAFSDLDRGVALALHRAGTPANDPTLAALALLQTLRAQLWTICHPVQAVVHEGRAFDAQAAFLQHLPAVTFVFHTFAERWTPFRAITLQVGEPPENARQAVARFDAALDVVADALDLQSCAPVAAQLFTVLGRPPTHKTIAQHAAWSRVRTLCGALTTGADSAQAEAAVTAVSDALGVSQRFDCDEIAPDSVSTKLHFVATVLVGHHDLREQLVQGVALALSGLLHGSKGSGTDVDEHFLEAIHAAAQTAAADVAERSLKLQSDTAAVATPGALAPLLAAHVASSFGRSLQHALWSMQQRGSAATLHSAVLRCKLLSAGRTDSQQDIACLRKAAALLARSSSQNPLHAACLRAAHWSLDHYGAVPIELLHMAAALHGSKALLRDRLPQAPSAVAALLPHRISAAVQLALSSDAKGIDLSCINMEHSGALPLVMAPFTSTQSTSLRDLPSVAASLKRSVHALLVENATCARLPHVPLALECANLCALMAQIVAAYSPLCEPAQPLFASFSQTLGAAASLLAEVPCMATAELHSASQALIGFVPQVAAALKHPDLPALARGASALVPAVSAVAAYVAALEAARSADAACSPTPAALADVGSSLLDLGLWRVALLQVKGALDPALEVVERARHLSHMRETETLPKLRVARALQPILLVPCQAAHAAAFVQDATNSEVREAALLKQRRLRPEVSQWPALVAELTRFTGAALAPDVLTALSTSIRSALTAANEPDGGAAGLEKLRALAVELRWRADNIVAWTDDAPRRYPLYDDVLAAFVLAAHEVVRGLGLLLTAALHALGNGESDPAFLAAPAAAVVSSLVAYPPDNAARAAAGNGTDATGFEDAATRIHAGQPALAGAALADVSTQTAALAAVKQAALRLAERVSPSPETLRNLQLSLDVSLELRALLVVVCSTTPRSAIPAIKAARQRLASAFERLAVLWRQGQEVRAELQRREDALFKPAAERERVLVRTSEEDEESAFREEFRDPTSAFSEFLQDAAADEALAVAAADEDDALLNTDDKAMRAVLQQLQAVLEDSGAQHELVTVHAAASAAVAQRLQVSYGPDFAADLVPDSNGTPTALSAYRGSALDSAYGLGCAVLEGVVQEGGVLDTYIDCAALGGVLRQCLQNHARLRVQKRSASAAERDGLNLNVACLDEASLAVAPVSALHDNVQHLLHTYPGQPMLVQFRDITDRLLRLPAQAPLKEAMVGLELLLTRLKTWQDHNASEREGTSLAAHESPLAQIVARWRRLELQGWARTIDAALEAERRAAWRHWYTLQPLLTPVASTADGCDDSVLATLEDFLQTSSLSHFKPRLQLLSVFQRTCAAAVALDASPRARHLTVCIGNVLAYYGQHAEAVNTELERVLKPIRKELKDYVKLERWEHQGYHDLRLATERSQRKLAKCRRQAIAAARQPVTPLLARLAKSLGLPLVTGLVRGLSVDAVLDAGADAADGEAERENEEPAGLTNGRSGAEKNVTRENQSSSAEALVRQFSPALLAWLPQMCYAVGKGLVPVPPWSSADALATQLANPSAYRNRDLQALTRRLTARLSRSSADGSHLPDVLTAWQSSSEQALLEGMSMGVQVRDLWAQDGTKGVRSRRKKALTDYLKQLQGLGLSTSRSAVPASQRTTNSWFTQLQLTDLPPLDAAALPLPADASSALYEAWGDSATRFQQAIAAVHELRRCAGGGGAHADISRREASAMLHLVEHLLYLARQQHASLHAASATLSALRVVLPVCRAHAGASPAPASTQARLKDAVPQLLDALNDSVQLLLDMEALAPGSDIMQHAGLEQAFSGSVRLLRSLRSALTSAASDLAAALKAHCLPFSLHPTAPGSHDSAMCCPLAITPTLTRAMQNAATAIMDAQAAIVQHGSEVVKGWDSIAPQLDAEVPIHNAFPCWKRLGYSVGEHARLSAEVLELSGGSTDERPSGDDAAMGAAAAIERALCAVLVWSQETTAARDFLQRGADNGDADAGDAGAQSILACVEAAQRMLDHDALRRVCCGLTEAIKVGSGSALPAPLAAQLAGVTSMADMVAGALSAAVVHCVMLHAACTQLLVMTAAVFMAFLRDGFGQGESEEVEGEGDGEGVFKESDGTGLGDGDTSQAKDVSHQIEDEDQIMGAQTREQQEQQERDDAERGAGADDDDDDREGIEMQQEFDGDITDVPKDADAGQSDDEEAEAEEPELDKEMGDAGDDADVVDDAMWNDGDDADEDEGPKKDAGYNEHSSKERGDPSTRKMVAAEAPDDDAAADDNDHAMDTEQQPEDGKADDAAEEEERSGEGEVPEDEIAAQMAADDHAQPQAEPQELEIEDNLDLDGDMEGSDQDADEHGDHGVEEDQAPVVEQRGADDQDGDGDSGGEDAQVDEALGDDEEAKEVAEEGAGAPPDGATAMEDDEAGADNDTDALPEPISGAADEEVPGEEDNDPVPAGPRGVTGAAEQPQAGAGGDAAAAVPLPAAADGDASSQAPPQAGADAKSSHTAGAGGGSGPEAPRVPLDSRAAQSKPAAAADDADAGNSQAPDVSTGPSHETNPLRDLGNAREQWLAKLNIVQDGAEDEDWDGGTGDADAEDAAATQGLEYEFTRQREDSGAPGAQALAAATDEQVEAQRRVADDCEEDRVAADTGMQEEDASGADRAHEAAASEAMDEGEPGQTQHGGGAGRMQAPIGGDTDATGKDAPAPEDELATPMDLEDQEPSRPGDRSDAAEMNPNVVSAALPDTAAPLEAATEAVLDKMELLLRDDTRAGDAGDAAAADRGRQLWRRCSSLTAGLAAELVEQLRLVLEPTLASRLSGDYKTGKRLNLKKVIGYVASNFRQDKIWLRRTRPDKRQYQVMLAVDESRSMRENRCALFACEALALLTTALSRLEVGSLGVSSFGGTRGPRVLHGLDAPWTDASAQYIFSQLHFDADNTLADTPMLDLVAAASQEFAAARSTFGTPARRAQLSQLLLVVADGHFNEKDALRRAVREATSGDRQGLLIVFIVLDTKDESVLQLQSVSFENGQPVFKRYMDSFPFPHYLVLRDMALLPRMLADLLRQWFRLCSS